MSKNKKKRRNRTIQNTQKINRNVTERNTECDSGKKSIFFAKFKNTLRSLPKKILEIITNIFSYSTIFALLLFAYGKISGDNRSDNDLLKKQMMRI